MFSSLGLRSCVLRSEYTKQYHRDKDAQNRAPSSSLRTTGTPLGNRPTRKSFRPAVHKQTRKPCLKITHCPRVSAPAYVISNISFQSALSLPECSLFFFSVGNNDSNPCARLPITTSGEECEDLPNLRRLDYCSTAVIPI